MNVIEIGHDLKGVKKTYQRQHICVLESHRTFKSFCNPRQDYFVEFY